MTERKYDLNKVSGKLYQIESFQVRDISVSFWSHMPHEDLLNAWENPQPGDCHVDGPAAQGGMSGESWYLYV